MGRGRAAAAGLVLRPPAGPLRDPLRLRRQARRACPLGLRGHAGLRLASAQRRATPSPHISLSAHICPHLPISPAASLGARRLRDSAPWRRARPSPLDRAATSSASIGALLRVLPGHSCAVNSVSWRPEPPIPRFLAAPPRPPLLSGGRPCIGARPRRTCLPRLPTTTLSAFGGCRHPRFRRLARRRLAVPAPAGPRLRGCEGLSALRSLQLCIVERGAGDLERVAEIYQGSSRGQRPPALAPRWPGSRHSAMWETRRKQKGETVWLCLCAMAADTRQERIHQKRQM